jgi:hypothetical protein
MLTGSFPELNPEPIWDALDDRSSGMRWNPQTIGVAGSGDSGKALILLADGG